LGVVAETS